MLYQQINNKQTINKNFLGRGGGGKVGGGGKRRKYLEKVLPQRIHGSSKQSISNLFSGYPSYFISKYQMVHLGPTQPALCRELY